MTETEAAGAENICFLSIEELGRRLRSGALGAVTITDAFLARIKRLDPHLQSYVHLMEGSAHEEAASADHDLAAGHDRGPLHGIPVGIKDLADARGAVTAAGMAIHADRRPTEDATIVARLRSAGAVILGKLAMTEGAMMAHHPSIAVPRNPWHPGHDSGFSSSGSGVAVAAGLCAAAIGSDTGGSIRIPAAFNGVTGLKPTQGRVSRHGIHPLVDYLDTIGPMARSARGAAAILGAIAGADPRDPTAEAAAVPDYLGEIDRGIRDVRVGVDWQAIDAHCEPAVAAALRDAAAALANRGAVLTDAAVPPLDLLALMPYFAAGVAASHNASYPVRAEDYGPDARALLDAGRAATGVDVAAGITHADAFRTRMRALFGHVDLMLTPALAMPAPPAGFLIEQAAIDPDFVPRRWAYTVPFNISGSPTITFPTGFHNGLPIAAQLIGPHFSESLLLRAADAYQSASDWHLCEPPCSRQPAE